jgi:hypothetical protein
MATNRLVIVKLHAGGRCALATLCLALAACSVHAQSQKFCPGLTGPARTTCLKEEMAKAQAESAAARKRLAILDRTQQLACTTAKTLDKAAKAAERAGTITQSKPFKYGGKIWTSSRALSSDATKEAENCESARKAVASARGRQ